MFDPSFFSFGNGLFYNPMTDSVQASAPASNTGTVKGREYDIETANNLKTEIANQTNVLGVDHRASFTKDQDKIIDDMAKQLASYGVTSLADIKPELEEKQFWAVPRYDFDDYGNSTFTGQYDLYDQDPNASYDGPSPTSVRQASEADLAQLQEKGTITTRVGAINAKTGESIPLNKLNNSAGSGFTWYNVEFIDGQAVPYAWKESTGAGALGDQIKAMAQPLAPVAVALLTPIVGAPAASAIVNTVLTGDVTEGLKAGATTFLGNQASNFLADTSLESIFSSDAVSESPATSSLLGGDAEAQIGGFYGNTPTAEFDPKLGGTYITQNGRDVFIPLTPTETGSLLDTVNVVGTPAPSLLAPLTTVNVSGTREDNGLLGTVNVIGTRPDELDMGTVTVTGTRPDEPDLGVVTVTGTRPTDMGTINVVGTAPTDVGTVEITGTRPDEPDMGTVTVIGERPEEPDVGTVTVVGTAPGGAEVFPVAPPPPIEETPLEPKTELPDLPSLTMTTPPAADDQQMPFNYQGVDYSQLLALLTRELGLLSPARQYYRGLLG